VSDYREQTARPTAGDIGTPALFVRNDSPGDLSTTNLYLAMGQLDSAGLLRVTEEGGKATYFATSQFASDATGTDIAVFVGVATKTAKLFGIQISSTATAAATGDLSIIRRSALDTGGTAANASVAQADGRDVAPAITPQHYTAHPTGLGASAGILWGQRYIQPAVSTTLLPGFFIDFRQYNGGKPIRVSGTTDVIAVNIAAALGGSGNAFDITWIWCEEPTTA